MRKSDEIRGYNVNREALNGVVGKPVQMDSSSPSQLLAMKSQEHEEAHSGSKPV